MKYLIILTAAALFYYLIGAFIYGTFNSVLWNHEGKIGLSFCYGMTAFICTAFSMMTEEQKQSEK